MRWERFGEGAVIDVVDNMTRLALDTIALCAMSYRFNSFYQNESHSFVGVLLRQILLCVIGVGGTVENWQERRMRHRPESR
jgi:hypothetical protein